MGEGMTDAAFAAKVHWEGGVYDALDYGLSADSLQDQDGELAREWRRLQDLMRQVSPLVNRVEMLLQDAVEEELD